MLLTTFGAMSYNPSQFLSGESPKYALAVITVLLMIMALFLVVRSVQALRTALAGRRPEPEPDPGNDLPSVGLSD